jgi:DNA-binding transcriptional LysR family regulator
MYNYNHLYYFYTTVKSGSVTSAAKHLSISQPSLSGQLKVLETFLQIKLFKKVGRVNELTTEGGMIFGFCRQMFELSEEMNESIIERIPYASRKIHIGVSNEIANSFVVEVISHFLKKYTDKFIPKVTMISGTHDRLSEQLRFREIDVVVTSLSMTHPELDNLQSIEVPVNLICAVDNRTINLENRSLSIHSVLKALSQNKSKSDITQWVMPNTGFKLRSEINQFFEEKSIKGRIVFESDVMESLVRSAVDKIGIAFLPLIYVPKELEHKSLYSLGPKLGYWKHRIWLSSHHKNKNDFLVKSLSHSFKEVCTPLCQSRSRLLKI